MHPDPERRGTRHLQACSPETYYATLADLQTARCEPFSVSPGSRYGSIVAYEQRQLVWFDGGDMFPGIICDVLSGDNCPLQEILVDICNHVLNIRWDTPLTFLAVLLHLLAAIGNPQDAATVQAAAWVTLCYIHSEDVDAGVFGDALGATALGTRIIIETRGDVFPSDFNFVGPNPTPVSIAQLFSTLCQNGSTCRMQVNPPNALPLHETPLRACVAR